jgi:uncharacterized protein (DUF433 family)
LTGSRSREVGTKELFAAFGFDPSKYQEMRYGLAIWTDWRWRPRLRFESSAFPARRTGYSDGVQPLTRISTNPEIMGGKRCIRGTRVTVGMIVDSLAAGRSVEDLLNDFRESFTPVRRHDAT